jgi:hypothetical protein
MLFTQSGRPSLSVDLLRNFNARRCDGALRLRLLRAIPGLRGPGFCDSEGLHSRR